MKYIVFNTMCMEYSIWIVVSSAFTPCNLPITLISNNNFDFRYTTDYYTYLVCHETFGADQKRRKFNKDRPTDRLFPDLMELILN